MDDSLAEDKTYQGDDERFIIQFKAATGFMVVLEFSNLKTMEENKDKIESAGLECERIAKFSVNFDQADLFMDMRSPECIAQFDLDDWI
jgi:hypothetical protein